MQDINNKGKDIFTRDLNGELISPDDKDFSQILEIIENTQKLVHRLAKYANAR